MIKEMQRLVDGSYLISWAGIAPFHGSRVELIVYLAEQGFEVEEAGLILQILDSLPAVNLLATRQGYC